MVLATSSSCDTSSKLGSWSFLSFLRRALSIRFRDVLFNFLFHGNCEGTAVFLRMALSGMLPVKIIHQLKISVL